MAVSVVTIEQQRFFDSIGKMIVAKAKSNLSSAKGATALEGTIDYDVVKIPEGLAIYFKMADYGTFVDKGVKGKGGTIVGGKYDGSWGGRRYFTTYEGKRKDSPYKFGSGSGPAGGLTKAIGKWIKTKGLKGRDEKTGRFITDKSLVFLISRNIYIRGVHGISFFQNAIQKGIKDLGKGYEVAFIEDFDKTMKNVIKQ
tara:strand:- start:12237 stop:12830 length:594 start_codon:yes stop_codon:yes gene_type:complete